MRIPPVYNAEEKVWRGPEIDQRMFDVPFGELLLSQLKKHGEKLFQINHDTGERMTRTELRLRSLKAAEYLEKIGIKRGDHVSIIAKHRSDVAPLFLGIVAYGAVVNLMWADSTAHELCQLFKIIQPKLIICDYEAIDNIKNSLEFVSNKPMIYTFSNAKNQVRSTEEFFVGYDTEPSTFQLPQIFDLSNTTAVILLTSGSTSLPKVWCISHTMALSRLSSTFTAANDVLRYYAINPAGSITSREIAESIFYCSPRIISAQPLTDDNVLDVLQKHNVNVVSLYPYSVTSLSKRMLTESFNLTKLAMIETGGAALSEIAINNLSRSAYNVEIGKRYAMTELGIIASSNAKPKPNSLGYLMAGISAKIVDDYGNSLGPGEIGEIIVQQGCPFLGYLNNEEATKNTINADGWLLTGDIGYIDTDGELFLVDRKKIIIEYESFQIPPSLLENFVRNQFDILDIVVVGIPAEDDLGELPAAVIVLPPKSNITESDITKAIEDNFSPIKHLKGGTYFVKSLPKTASGKVHRNRTQQIAMELYGLQKQNINN